MALKHATRPNRLAETMLSANITCWIKLALGIGGLLLSPFSLAHGLKDPTANIEVFPNGLVNIKVQFYLLDFLKRQGAANETVDLAALAVMPPPVFQMVYDTVRQAFVEQLTVTCHAAKLDRKTAGELQAEPQFDAQQLILNRRFPSGEQAHRLIQREVVEAQYANSGKPPYTYDDRRFFQVFNADFKLTAKQSAECLRIRLPSELGTVYVSYSSIQARHVDADEEWSKRNAP